MSSSDYLIVRLDNQSNIVIINQNQINRVADGVSPSSNQCQLTNDIKQESQLINAIRGKVKQWIDELGVKSAEAQNLKEPITCHTRFIQGSFREHSPHKHQDSIYFLINVPRKVGDHPQPNQVNPTAIGFVRVGQRNLFLQNKDQLVKVERCFSVLDFFLTQQRQGLGKLLLSHVLIDQGTSINKFAFDRPTPAMLSFLGKHFKLGPPRHQHNRFVIYDDFFLS